MSIWNEIQPLAHRSSLAAIVAERSELAETA
jgi:hypothetical protein